MQSHHRSPKLYNFMLTGRSRWIKKGSAVYTTDTNKQIAMLESGYVKSYMIKNDGSISVQKILGPQDMFPLAKLYDCLLGFDTYDGPETYYHMALCNSRVLLVDVEAFRLILNEQPALYKELFFEAGQHIKYSEYTTENTSLASAYNRVAHQLLFFIKAFGIKTDHGTKLAIPLTHQDYADILSTTRETVSLAMKRLQHTGVITDARDVTVPNIDALSNAAYE